MDFDDALEMAKDPNNILGIYNYCDAWCERCLFTSKCLTFKTNKRFLKEHDQELREKENVEFWQQVDEAIEDVKDLMDENESTTTDLIELDFDADDFNDLMSEHEKQRQKAKLQPISKAAKRYMNDITNWSKEMQNRGVIIFPDSREEVIEINIDKIKDQIIKRRLSHAVEIAFYYHFQIWVKINRALTSSYNDFENDPDFKDCPKDSDGSAKVALLGIDQSIAAWTTLFKYISSMKPEVNDFIQLLQQLRNAIEMVFPEARKFHRPGLDD